jgi:hypothetical protein
MEASMNTPESLKEMSSALILRGVPVEYAQRAAREFADHHSDLVDELRASGMSELQAVTEASRRLGDSRTLVRKTVRQYQRRFWCGRWPIITFAIAPPILLAVIWTSTCLSLVPISMSAFRLFGKSEVFEAFNETICGAALVLFLKVWIMLISTSAVTAVFQWLAMRAALALYWPMVAASCLFLCVGFLTCEIKLPLNADPTGCLTFTYRLWFLPEFWNFGLLRFLVRDYWQISQILLPFAVSLLAMGYLSHRRNLASQFASGC